MDKAHLANGQMLIQRIDRYSDRVKKRNVKCATNACCYCGHDATTGQTPFAFHGTRARRFLVLVGSYVHKVGALLARWRCPRCQRTFTDYPPFACPYKAYTLPQMIERAATYISTTSTSYRDGVCSASLPIFYAEGDTNSFVQSGTADALLNLSTMAHTSLFRWVTSLGRKASPCSQTVQADFTPPSRKYASEERRSILVACWGTCSVFFAGPAPAELNG